MANFSIFVSNNDLLMCALILTINVKACATVCAELSYDALPHLSIPGRHCRSCS